MPSIKSSTSPEVTLGDLWSAIYARRQLILVLAFSLGVAAAGLSFLIRPQYTAETLLSPVTDTNPMGNAATSLASQFGGLASLTGVNLGGGDDRARVAVATLGSRALTMDFIRERELLPVLFASQWDRQKAAWKTDNASKIPTLWDGDRYFGRYVRKISEDKKSGLITVVVVWSDPQIAADWANDLVTRTNAVLRIKAASEASRNLAFLEQQLSRTSIIEVRQSIYRLMENEIKALTLAEGQNEYAFRVIDPAVPPSRRSAPNRKLFLLGGLVTGLIAGILLSLIIAPIKRD